MSFVNWKISAESVFSKSTIIPVLVLHDIKQALSVAEAIIAGGVNILELTLRTPQAFAILEALITHFPQACIGVGTVVNVEQLQKAADYGAQFAISPGHTEPLLLAGRDSCIPLIPGISTISELMYVMDLGYSYCKFFPAEIAGGLPMLRTIHTLFPQVRFCPTGGINAQNFKEYLALPNVSCVGGSWLAPEDLIKNAQWSQISDRCSVIA